MFLEQAIPSSQTGCSGAIRIPYEVFDPNHQFIRVTGRDGRTTIQFFDDLRDLAFGRADEEHRSRRREHTEKLAGDHDSRPAGKHGGQMNIGSGQKIAETFAWLVRGEDTGPLKTMALDVGLDIRLSLPAADESETNGVVIAEPVCRLEERIYLVTDAEVPRIHDQAPILDTPLFSIAVDFRRLRIDLRVIAPDANELDTRRVDAFGKNPVPHATTKHHHRIRLPKTSAIDHLQEPSPKAAFLHESRGDRDVDAVLGPAVM